MKLTPEKIREIYDNTTPYQVEDTMKYYIGQKIYWDLKYSSIISKKNLNLMIILNSLDKNVPVICNINENDFHLIKILPQNTPVKLVGTIKEIGIITIEIENAQLHEIRDKNGQIYFPQGSREELLLFLESKILGAKNIKIYDSYPSEDILKLLESASLGAEIRLLGKDIDTAFSEKIKAFNTYFNKNMIAKKINVSHARFYIIDDVIFQVDSSLKNSGGDKATMVHMIDKEPAEAVETDFDKWWNEATII
jgi:hypothetical protein